MGDCSPARAIRAGQVSLYGNRAGESAGAPKGAGDMLLEPETEADLRLPPRADVVPAETSEARFGDVVQRVGVFSARLRCGRDKQIVEARVPYLAQRPVEQVE